MTKEFSSIVELKSIREQKSRLSEREQELSSPILTDFTLIPEIYDWFREILSRTDCPPIQIASPSGKSFFSLCYFSSLPVYLLADGCRMVSGQRFPVCSRMFPRV